MIRPDLEALLQGALDHSLTADERARLARMLSEHPEARARAAELDVLAGLIDTLGPADAPAGLVDNVLAQISHRPRVHHATFQRGIAVNKKILFGLAAAAAVVLAVITYNSNPPATVGTEATIGAAQRAQTPQIAPQDVKLGDTSAQDVLQTDTFDAILKDETLRNLFQDAAFRRKLEDASLRNALQEDAIKRALADPNIARRLEDAALKRALSDPAAAKKLEDASLRALVSNRAFADALRSDHVRQLMSRPGAAKAMASDAFQAAIRDRNFDAAVRTTRFAEAMARGTR